MKILESTSQSQSSPNVAVVKKKKKKKCRDWVSSSACKQLRSHHFNLTTYLIIQIEATQLCIPSDWAQCSAAFQKYPSVPREETGSSVNYLSQLTS